MLTGTGRCLLDLILPTAGLPSGRPPRRAPSAPVSLHVHRPLLPPCRSAPGTLPKGVRDAQQGGPRRSGCRAAVATAHRPLSPEMLPRLRPFLSPFPSSVIAWSVRCPEQGPVRTGGELAGPPAPCLQGLSVWDTGQPVLGGGPWLTGMSGAPPWLLGPWALPASPWGIPLARCPLGTPRLAWALLGEGEMGRPQVWFLSHEVRLSACGQEGRGSVGLAVRGPWGVGTGLALVLALAGARGDSVLSSPQYKVLSVLPGSGMGIAVSTPSTQKVSARRVGPGAALGGPCSPSFPPWGRRSPTAVSGVGSPGREGGAGGPPQGWGPGLCAGGGSALIHLTFWGSAGTRAGAALSCCARLRGSPTAFPPCQPLVFGAMVHRDEAFETIFSQYVKITAAAASGTDS